MIPIKLIIDYFVNFVASQLLIISVVKVCGTPMIPIFDTNKTDYREISKSVPDVRLQNVTVVNVCGTSMIPIFDPIKLN